MMCIEDTIPVRSKRGLIQIQPAWVRSAGCINQVYLTFRCLRILAGVADGAHYRTVPESHRNHASISLSFALGVGS